MGGSVWSESRGHKVEGGGRDHSRRYAHCYIHLSPSCSLTGKARCFRVQCNLHCADGCSSNREQKQCGWAPLFIRHRRCRLRTQGRKAQGSLTGHHQTKARGRCRTWSSWDRLKARKGEGATQGRGDRDEATLQAALLTAGLEGQEGQKLNYIPVDALCHEFTSFHGQKKSLQNAELLQPTIITMSWQSTTPRLKRPTHV